MDILRSIRDFHEHGARSIDYIDHQSQQQLQIPCFPCLPPYASICESIFTIFCPYVSVLGRVFPSQTLIFITFYYTIGSITTPYIPYLDYK